MADRTEARLRVVGTWQMPLIGVVPLPINRLPTPQFMAKQCNTMVCAGIGRVGTRLTKLPVVRVSIGTALVALLGSGITADGKRGHSEIAAKVLGSVADHMVSNRSISRGCGPQHYD